MTQSDEQRWDQRYAEGAYAERQHPSAFLVERLDDQSGATATNLTAADLACGRGRNAAYLASLGYTVSAYDVSSVGLSHAQATYGADINWVHRDLIADGLEPSESFDLIVMFRFVAPELLAGLASHLNPGGRVIVEEHLRWSGPEELAGPGSDRFRVAPNALRKGLDHLTIEHYFEGLVTDPDGKLAAVARAVARA